MTWQYAGAYAVSVITSPPIDLAFVLGVVTGWALRAWSKKEVQRPG